MSNCRVCGGAYAHRPKCTNSDKPLKEFENE